MTDPEHYVRAFERNCPLVRLTKDERTELRRLFFEMFKAAHNDAIQRTLREFGER